LLAFLLLLIALIIFVFKMLVERSTSRRQKQSAIIKKLQESEQRYQLAMEGSHDGIWDWDIQTGASFCSPRFAELLGFDLQDVSSDPFGSWFAALHPDDRDATSEAMRLHLEEHVPYDV